MKDNNCRPKQSKNLRHQAEKIAREKLLQSSVNTEAMSLEETRLMLHELQVHQIELEMQNEELRRIQEELNVTQECYFDLYNTAPVGYVTSDKEGRIVQANLTTATLLGIVRESLVNQTLTRFILPEDQDIYYHHRKKVFKIGESQVCDLRMMKADGTAFWASLITNVVEQEGDSPLYLIILTDISERKTSEETIRRSEERYQAIINASPLAIFLLRNGRYHYANPAARMMLGYPLDCDISTVSIDQTITPAQLTHIRQRINSGETGLANPPIELTIIKADGSSTVTESTSIPIQLEDGPAVLAMGIDINDRKKSDDLLKARLCLSEASTFLDLDCLLTMALDEVEILTGSQIGFFHLFDEDEKTISLHAWSTSTASTYCKTEGAGSHYKLEVAGVWADCIRERKTIVHNDFAGLLHRKGLPNGHAVVIRELVVPVFRNERIVAILGVGNKIDEYNDKDIDLVSNLANMAWDIILRKRAETALLESEEKHRFLIENSHDIIYTLNADGVVTFISPSWTNLLGHPVNQVVDKSFDTFIHPEDYAVWMARHQEVTMTEKRQEGIEYRMRHIDGSWRWHTSNIVPLCNEAGVIVGIEGISRDITERKNTEQALQGSLAEKEVLLREVHHRVKNNMAAIIGLLNLQRQAMDDPQVQTVLTELSSRVGAMSLVHEKLYRSDSLARIDFQDYIQSLTSHLRTSFGSPSIHCEIESAGVKMPLDLAVPCGMIINELITNALKYAFPAERSGVSDKIDRILIAMSHEKDIFSLSVADNGVGLPPGFDLNEAKTLGLVLVRMLGRHQLGGQYQIDQIGGTRFTLTFPRHGRKTH